MFYKEDKSKFNDQLFAEDSVGFFNIISTVNQLLVKLYIIKPI